MKKLIIIAALAASFCGCMGLDRSRYIEGKGMWANGKTGSVAIGALEIDAIPAGVESARLAYDEDTAWLQPQIKTHKFRVTLTGTNSIEKIDEIVKSISDAYQSTAPAIMQSNAQVATSPLLGASTLATAAASAKSLAETKAALKAAKSKLDAACKDCSPVLTDELCEDCEPEM